MKSQNILLKRIHQPMKWPLMLLRINCQKIPLRPKVHLSLGIMEQQSEDHHSLLRTLQHLSSLGQQELKQQINLFNLLQVQFKLLKAKNRKNFLNKKNQKKMKKRKNLRYLLDFLVFHQHQVLSNLKVCLKLNHNHQTVVCLESPPYQFLHWLEIRNRNKVQTWCKTRQQKTNLTKSKLNHN